MLNSNKLLEKCKEVEIFLGFWKELHQHTKVVSIWGLTLIYSNRYVVLSIMWDWRNLLRKITTETAYLTVFLKSPYCVVSWSLHWYCRFFRAWRSITSESRLCQSAWQLCSRNGTFTALWWQNKTCCLYFHDFTRPGGTSFSSPTICSKSCKGPSTRTS